MTYIVMIDGWKACESTSRDSKKHLQNHGGNRCAVYTKSDKLVSEARRDEGGNIYRCYIPR